MTRDEERGLWAIGLMEYGAESLEQKVLGFLSALLQGELREELPSLVSAEGLAQLVGLLLSEMEAGDPSSLGTLRNMNREHFRVLLHLRKPLGLSLLADLPAALVPHELLKIKLELELGM
jgi:hypothetical protein